MRISDELKNRIREEVSIVDFINTYVPLSKKGKVYKALCPFHEEKTPSFVVNPEKKYYHCFGCGAGGDVFKFVQDYKNVSFLEAVKEVAAFAGIEIKDDTNIGEKLDKNEKYYKINSLVLNFFSKILFESENAKSVREYLKLRDVKPATQRTFGLGYALPANDALLNFLKRNNVNLEDAQRVGLIDKNEKGNYYDRFRGRLIFPIHTTNGRIAGFGGRILQNNPKIAKYINSPESPIYTKRKILYGLYFSKEEIQRLNKAILVEGYMDVISLYQNGIKNVVAASGTSFTEDQARLLSRYTKNIVVIFDADEAGMRAAQRSIEVLLKAHFDIRLLTLPDGDDPDSYIKKHSPNSFRDLVNSAKDFLTFQAKRYEDMGMLDDPVKRTEAIRELVKSIALVDDELMRTNYILELSKNFEIKKRLLEDELEKYLEQKNKQEKYSAINKKRIAENQNSAVQTKRTDTTEFEKTAIKLLLSGKSEIMDEVFDYIHPEMISDKNLREIFLAIYDAYMEGEDYEPGAVMAKLDDNLRKIAADIDMNKDQISVKWGNIESEDSDEGLLKLTRDFIKRFQLKNLELQIREVTAKLAQAESDEDKKELLSDLQDLNDEKKHLLKQLIENE